LSSRRFASWRIRKSGEQEIVTAGEIVDLFIQLDRNPVALVREIERRTVSGQEAAKWIHELRRAHEYLDKGEPFFTGKDCAELADLIESIAAPIPATEQKDAE
jgi:hypothetical protein